MNISGFLEENVRLFGDYEKVYFNGKWITNKTLLTQSEAAAEHLHLRGIGRSDRVLVILPVCPDVHFLFPAIWRLGAVVVPLHYTSSQAEILRIARLTSAKAIVSTEEKLKDIGELDEASSPQMMTAEELKQCSLIRRPIPKVDLPEEHPAVIVFTSGSTGQPKGVIQSHGNLASLVEDCSRTKGANVPFGFFHEVNHVMLHFVSYGHTVGPFLLALGLSSRAKTVLVDKFDLRLLFGAIQDQKVTQVIGTPTFFEAMIKSGDFEKFDLSSVKAWVTNAAPISEEKLENIEKFIGSRVYQVYGLSESTSVLTVDRDDSPRVKGSVGKIIEGAEVKIVDDKGETLPVGADGELCIKRKANALGYLNVPEQENSKVFKGEWVHTGDICRLDADNNLYVIGRISQIINQGGLKIHPREIETVIERRPEVEKCVCLGYPDELFGKVAIAVVQPRPGSSPNEGLLQDFCRSHLAEEKVPRFILFISKLPETPTKKVDFPTLMKWAEELLNAPLKKTSPLSMVAAEQKIREELAALLRKSAGSLDADKPFMELGMTSLMSVQFAARLGKSLGCALPSTTTFNYPTISELAAHLSRTDETATETVRTGSDDQEPIAIVGYACKFAGVEETEQFWPALNSKRDLASKMPKSRWDSDVFKAVTDQGYFIDSFDMFDAELFGISRVDAELTDPQHRLFFESCWEALERAGMDPTKLHNSLGGVFTSEGSCEYLNLQQNLEIKRPENITPYSGTGALPTMLAGRISYLLGLQGPSLVVDTACSSSLVALHLACQSLRQGESDFALVGGVNLMLTPYPFLMLSAKGALSPSGRCQTFDEKADGYARGEGVVTMVLKRYSDALADGDHICAVVRGSAVNHDGRSSSLTAPNGLAQERVIRAALGAARVTPQEVSYVEAHGTGTPLGDPIEVQSLLNVYGRDRAAGFPLKIGSVKTVIGHTEAAAGLAGVLKVILAMKHGVIPSNMHFTKLNPHIASDPAKCRVVIEPTEWNGGGKPLLAGVSSFGISGTNAHVVLESYDAKEKTCAADDSERNEVLCLSAKSRQALSGYAGKYIRYLSEDSAGLAEVCGALRAHRPRFKERLAIVGKSKEEIVKKLMLTREGKDAPGAIFGAEQEEKKKIAFLFTGQGSQYTGMGRELYRTQPFFRRELDACAAVLDQKLSIPLFELLWNPDNRNSLNQTEFTQPCLFAFEYAMAKTWMSLGLQPDFVIGHSVGELAAAAVSDAITLAEGLDLIVTRAKLMSSLPGNGVMAAVAADDSEVEKILKPFSSQVAVAAVNGPSSVVISGLEPAISEVLKIFGEQKINTKKLTVSHAFHSPQMDPMLEDFRAFAAGLKFSKPSVPLISNLDGREVESLSADYWREHVRQPVRFAQGIETALSRGVEVFIEVGPGSVLTALGRTIASSNPKVSWWASSDKKKDEDLQFNESAAGLFAAGLLSWDEQGARKLADLPTYAFGRKSYLQEHIFTPRSAELAGGHPFLRQRIELAHDETKRTLFSGSIRGDEASYLLDHQVFGQAVIPGAFLIELALSASRAILASPSVALERFSILQPLVLPEVEAVEFQVLCSQENRERLAIEMRARAEGSEEWTLHFTCGATAAESAKAVTDFSESTCARSSGSAEIYAEFEKIGLDYGDSFRGLTNLKYGESEAVAEIVMPAGLVKDASRYTIHPTVLDPCFQMSIFSRLNSSGSDEKCYLPVGFDRLIHFKPLDGDVKALFKFTTPEADPLLKADILLLDRGGEPAVEIRGFNLHPASSPGSYRNTKDIFAYKLFEKALTSHEEEVPLSWLLIADDGDVVAEMESRIEKSGGSSKRVATRELSLAGRLADLWADPHPLGRIVFFGNGEAEALYKSALKLAQILVLDGDNKMPTAFVTFGAQLAEGWQRRVDPSSATLSGLLRGLRVERSGAPFKLIDMSPSGERTRPEFEQLYRELSKFDDEAEVLLRRSARFVPKLVRSEFFESGRAVKLSISERGMMENLRFVDAEKAMPGPGQVSVRVRATGLNFRDVMDALGLYPEPGELGVECSGVVDAVAEDVSGFQIGDEVIAIPLGGFSTSVNIDARLCVHKPRNMSFAESAGLPISFLTAHYALRRLAKVGKGRRILIHSGAGGLGLAAIQMATNAGAEIFVTVGSEEKRALMRSMGIRHIFHSRTLDFSEDILRATGGEGVDIVLNALAGEFIPRSLSLLRKNGVFLEVGKTGIWSSEKVRAVRPDVAYHIIALDRFMVEAPQLVNAMLAELMAEFAEESLKPLPVYPFKIQNVKDAFKLMSTGRHMGKLVALWPKALEFREDSVYVVSGGSGYLGQQTAKWLIAQNVKRIALLSRAKPSPALCEEARAEHVDLRHFVVDVADHDGVASVFKEIRKIMGPIRGIVHAAGALADAMISEQTPSGFHQVFRPKADGLLNLFEAVRSDQLDVFLAYSSVSAVAGGLGQANYAAANAFVDSFASASWMNERTICSINWGPWAEGGMAAALTENSKAAIRKAGLEFLPTAQAIGALLPLVESGMDRAAVLRLSSSATAASLPSVFSEITAIKKSPNELSAEFVPRLRLLKTPSERAALVSEFLREQICAVLELPESTRIDEEKSFESLGMDSLMSVWFGNRLKKSLSAEKSLSLPPNLTFAHPNCKALTAFILSGLSPENSGAVVNDSRVSSSIQDLQKTENPPEAVSNIKKDATPIYVLLHGYGQSMESVIEKFKPLLPEGSSYVAITAPYENVNADGTLAPGAFAWFSVKASEDDSFGKSCLYLRERMKSFLDAHPDREFIMIGFSQGGLVGLAQAEYSPKIVKAIVVLCPFGAHRVNFQPANKDFELVAVLRRDDRIVDFKDAVAGLRAMGWRQTREIILEGELHEIDQELGQRLSDLIAIERPGRRRVG